MGHRDPAYLQRVRELGCIVCRHKLGIEDLPPAAAHHLFDAHERDDYLTAPLCGGPEGHHQGPVGFHGLGGEPGFKALWGLSEVQLLALTLAGLNRGR